MRHMRDDFDVLHRLNEFLGVIPLVGPQGYGSFWVGCCLHGIRDHHLGCLSLSVAISGGDHGIGNEAVTVVTQGVPYVAQATGVIAFAVQPRIGIGAGVVGRVAALGTMKVRGISAACDGRWLLPRPVGKILDTTTFKSVSSQA